MRFKRKLIRKSIYFKYKYESIVSRIEIENNPADCTLNNSII